MRNFTTLIATIALATTVALAQPARYRVNQSVGAHGAAAGLNLAATVTLTGTVTAVNTATGSQYPTITLDQTILKVAPVWFFLENDFELEVGHQLAVEAAPALQTPGYYYALEIENLTTQKSIQLRDAQGRPLWIQGQNGDVEPRYGNRAPMQGIHAGPAAGPPLPAAYGGCLDTSSPVEITGQVVDVEIAAGIRQPALVLDIGGKLVTVRIGPLRLFFAADIELEPGDIVTVVAVVETCTGNLVALRVTVGDRTVVLRNPDGTPAW